MRIDHVVLSHPHETTATCLPILAYYAVGTVWDAGHVNLTGSMPAFYSAVATEPGVRFRTVRPIPPDPRVRARPRRRVRMPEVLDWELICRPGSRGLGEGAGYGVVTPTASARPEPERVQHRPEVELGVRARCLTGDVESGAAPESVGAGGGRCSERCSTVIPTRSTSTSSRWRTTARGPHSRASCSRP